MKKLLVFILLLQGFSAFSQINVIHYIYDAAGNRITRNPSTSTSVAQWAFTGTTRCAVNTNNINTGFIERQERDNNASSATYNQFRWALSSYNPNSCPLPPNWIPTGNYRCELDGNYNNTGNQEQEQIDNNPGSATYNQTQWVLYGYDPYSCPLPSTCDYYSCESMGIEYRCVYGYCEMGYKVVTNSWYNSSIGMYECTYHYEWSDGYWSMDYYDTSYYSCYY